MRLIAVPLGFGLVSLAQLFVVATMGMALSVNTTGGVNDAQRLIEALFSPGCGNRLLLTGTEADWLQRYFYLEEIDHRVLSNPEGEILDEHDGVRLDTFLAALISVGIGSIVYIVYAFAARRSALTAVSSGSGVRRKSRFLR